MRRVLVFSYLFPPVGGVTVQRTLGFLRHLREFGYEAEVIAAPPAARQLLDAGSDVPEGVRVHRCAAWEPRLLWAAMYKLGFGEAAHWLERLLFVPDGKMLWQLTAGSVAERIQRERPVDLVWSISMPFTAHLIARRFAKRHNLPWLAELRDEWTLHPMERFPTPLHRAIHRHWEARTYRDADRVAFTTQGFLEMHRSLAPDGGARFRYLPHGYEAAAAPSYQPGGAAFRIVYTGSFYRGYNIAAFFEGLRRALASGIPRQGIEVRFVGNLGNLQAPPDLADVVRIGGFVSHAEALALQTGADALLLVIASLRGKGHVPGKFYELCAAGPPVLALAPPEGDCERELLRLRAGTSADPESPAAIAEAILAMYQKWQSGHATRETDELELARFSRRALSRRLADIFDEMGAATEI